MLQTGTPPPDVSMLKQAITERVGAGKVAFVDSKRIAELVFGNHLLANVVILGAAFQLGGLPLSLGDIDHAMEQQGKSAGTTAPPSSGAAGPPMIPPRCSPRCGRRRTAPRWRRPTSSTLPWRAWPPQPDWSTPAGCR